MRLLNLIPSGDGCGWGICGHHLSIELPKLVDIVTDPKDCDIVLVPGANWEWSYACGHNEIADARRLKKPIIGYFFNEFQSIGEQQIHRLIENYAGVVCGSQWMELWLRNALEDVATDFPTTTAYQGVDYELFNEESIKHRPKEFENKFSVMVGGKLEYRKGQDLAIRAFQKFYKNAPEAILIYNMSNPWPNTALTLRDSKHITLDDLHLVKNAVGGIDVHHIDEKLIPLDRQYSFAMGNNASMNAFYGAADVGIFPSRCEAGTNLVLQEALSCGVTSLVSDYSGHEDLLYKVDDSSIAIPISGDEFYYKMENGDNCGKWFESCTDKLASELYRLYKKRNNAVNRNSGRLAMQNAGLTWGNTAKSIVNICNSVK